MVKQYVVVLGGDALFWEEAATAAGARDIKTIVQMPLPVEEKHSATQSTNSVGYARPPVTAPMIMLFDTRG